MRNKNNVRARKGCYKDWLHEREGYDPFSLERLSGASSPSYIPPTPPLVSDAYEVLEELYHSGKLKGRQKQIVTLLMAGITRQTDIAKRLSMKQGNVSMELRKIGKKITDNII